MRKSPKSESKSSLASPAARPAADRGSWAAPLLLVVAGLAVYCRTFDVPLVFDDVDRIAANPAIRTLWPVWVPMATTNRPLGMFSFALNYALHGYQVWGYHATNLAIHLAAALALWDIARRTLGQSAAAERFRPAAAPLALVIALAWLVHPLETESVTYVVQRLESLMGLCYLATLCFFVRSRSSLRPAGWQAAAVAVCALGMGTKEVMVTAPLTVLLYDRIFVAATWREILDNRRIFYLGLAASEAVLAWSMLHWQEDYSSGLIGTSGELTRLDYLLSQAGVIVHYLRLCVWPTGLCLDTAWPVAHGVGQIVPPLLVVGSLLLATGWALYRRPACGFLGACFFVLLAPTSSLVPIHDLAVEHRMYLASAVVIAAVVLSIYRLGQKLQDWSVVAPSVLRWTGIGLAGSATFALGLLCLERNEIYRSPIALWQDTLHGSPQNARTCCNLGKALGHAGQPAEALAMFQKAVELAPNYWLAQFNLGTTLSEQCRFDEAVVHLQAAAELKCDDAATCNNLGLALCQQQRVLDGVGYLARAVELQPGSGKYQNALGAALYDLGQHASAIEHLERAVELMPLDASAHYNLGNALLADKQFAAALRHYRQTLAIEPNHLLAAQVHYGLGTACASAGEHEHAVAEFERALALQPDYPAAARGLRRAQASAGLPAANLLR